MSSVKAVLTHPTCSSLRSLSNQILIMTKLLLQAKSISKKLSFNDKKSLVLKKKLVKAKIDLQICKKKEN